MDRYKREFPKNFFWGASTAAHQVEGGNHNDWTVWELANAQELARTAHQRLGHMNNWPDIKKQAEDPNNYVAGKGIEHYERYKEDFDLAKKLNLNSFRFGIEWSRIEPEEGVWNQKAIQHYKEYISTMRAKGIEPMLNIWHWTMPTWFADKGGFRHRRNLKYWERFVAKVAEELMEEVTYVITLNEPNVYVTFGYLLGIRPPQKKSIWHSFWVYWHLAKAHKQSYRILKAAKPSLTIGVASQLANVQAKRPHSFFDEATTKVMRAAWNWWFLNRIKHHQDFVGINYYFSDYYKLFHIDNPAVPKSDLDWYMEPEGLYPLLLRAWTHYKKPIMVTENGVADAGDQYRQWWLEETILAMERAMSEGVHIQGYYHWSLLDNFEWDFGWWPKFGLIEVDRKNGMKRTIRPSAHWLAKEIAEIQSPDS